MACMEHYCTACGHTDFNNEGRPKGGGCPKCGSRDVISTFDEDVDRGSDREPEPEGDEEDADEE